MSPEDPWELLNAASARRLDEMGHDVNAAAEGNRLLAVEMGKIVNEQTKVGERQEALLKRVETFEKDVADDIKEMRGSMKNVTTALVGFALTVTSSAIAFAVITVISR